MHLTTLDVPDIILVGPLQGVSQELLIRLTAF